MLCRAWCHKMQWCLNQELASEEGAGLEFTDEIMAAYNEPRDLTHLSPEELAGSGEQLGKLRLIPTRMLA